MEGFTNYLIGFVKPGFGVPWDDRFTYLILGLGVVAFFKLLVFLALVLCNVGAGRKVSTQAAYEQSLVGVNVVSKISFKSWLNRAYNRNSNFASQCSFIAGNAFFEVLFSDAQTKTTGQLIASYLYIGANTLTVIFGVACVVLSSVQAVQIKDGNYVPSIDALNFQSYVTSLFLWTGTFLVLDTAKWYVILWSQLYNIFLFFSLKVLFQLCLVYNHLQKFFQCFQTNQLQQIYQKFCF